MKQKLLSFCLLFCLGLFSIAFAQERTVTGRITDADTGEPLPGVSVFIKGTNTGTVTDVDGRYSLSVPGSATLVFQAVGMETKEMAVGSESTVDMQMKASLKELGEVVVTAQGDVREKKALGYAVSTVESKSIADRPVADVGRVLQGKIPGVNITSTSGVSGTGTNINIRGFSSLTGNVQPLFVVDGVPFNSNTNSAGNFAGGGGQIASSRFLDIDPNNIENVSVLKGLAAATLYGDQGRNGVILITTKNSSQKNRPAEVTLTHTYAQNTAVLPNYQNTYAGGFQQNGGFFFSNWGPRFNEIGVDPTQAVPPHPYAALQDASLRSQMASFVAANPYEFRAYPNNVSDFFRTGVINNTSLNVSGGTGSLSYNASVGYNNEQGYIPNNGIQRLSVGLGVRAQVSKKLTISMSFNFTNTETQSPPLNAGTGNNTLNGFPSVLANVMYTPRSVDLTGLPFESPVDNRSVYFRSGNDIPNPRWVLKYYQTPSSVNRIFSSNSIIYDITKDLSLSYRVGLDTYNEKQEFRFNKGGVDFVNGAYRTRDITNTIWNHDVILVYNKKINESFTIGGKLGANMRNDLYKEVRTNSENQITFGLMRHNNFLNTLANDFIQEETRMGIYGDITADYKGFIFLNFAARNDWTSTVEIENRRIFYPSASLSFIPTQAFPSLQNKVLNFLKIRGGIGTSAGFPTPYSTRNILNQNARAFLDPNGNVSSTHTVDNFLGNPNLKPELQTEIEFGAEARFFNWLTFDFTYFRRETRDLITTTPLDPASGFTSTRINLGKIRNTGYELAIGATPYQKNGFVWETSINYTRIIPLVVDLNGNRDVVIAGFTNLGNFANEGRPFNMIKGTAFQRDAQGRLLVAGDGSLIADPVLRELGNPNPAFTAAWINTFTYKGVSLSVMLDYRHGGAMYSSTAGALLGRGLTQDTEFDRSNGFIFPGVRSSDGAPNTTQVTSSDVYFNNIYFFGDEGRMFDATTIRIREVSLSYSLPKNIIKKTPFKGVSIAIVGNNVWFRAPNFPRHLNFDTDNLGLGVGNGAGFEFLTGPPTRRWGATVKLNF
jgi:TonB-linked SusC/RagA family outer membrane protein